MEKIRNKKGSVISYREKVYVGGKAVTKTFRRKSDAANWKKNYGAEVQKREALGIGHVQTIDFGSFFPLWLETKKNQNLAPRTIDEYLSTYRRYLLPILKKTDLERINQASVQKVIQLCRKNGIGAKRTNSILITLKQILNDAVKLDYLAGNPLKDMEMVKMKPRSLSYWLPEEVARFLSANEGSPLHPLFVVALNTGMRRGELAGLCWDKVNLGDGRIEVARIRDRYGLRDTTKTGTIRYLPINAPTRKTLEGLSRNKGHLRFVFTRAAGKPVDAHHMSERHFQKAVERAGLPKIRFHDLRTTYASNFVMAGGDVFALSKLLGHTSVEMTAKKYAALHPRFMRDVVETVNFG